MSQPDFIYLFVLDSFNPERLSTSWRLVGYESFRFVPNRSDLDISLMNQCHLCYK